MANADPTALYQQWLGSLDGGPLTRLLELRSDALLGTPVNSIRELAQRLTSTHSLDAAARLLPEGAIGMLYLLAALGPLDRERIGFWAQEGEAHSREAVDAALAQLTDVGIAFAVDGEYRTVDLSQLVRFPLGLGRPIATLFELSSDTKIRTKVLKNLGLKATGSKADNGLTVAAAMTPEVIRDILDEAPDAVIDELQSFVEESPRAMVYFGYASANTEPLVWAMDRGLLYRLDYTQVEMPREVGVALLGERWRPPLDLTPPPVSAASASAADVEQEAAHALDRLVHTAAVLLAEVDARPPALLKAGGVGVRDVRALAKTMGCDEKLIALLLNVAATAGLLTTAGGTVSLTEAYERWRREPRHTQAVELVTAWWAAPCSPSYRVPAGAEKPLAPLTPMPPDTIVPLLRSALLAQLSGADGALTSVEQAVDFACWYSPILAATTGTLHVEAAWREVQLVGAVAAGQVSSIGKLLAPQPVGSRADRRAVAESLAAPMRELLPAHEATVNVLSDLTVVVAGAAPPEVLDLLDSAAGRESRGTASTWRFTSATVRGFLDAGGDVNALLTRLTEISSTPLPQALEYLMRDEQRKHGHVAVRPAGCCIVSQDVPLIAEILATAALKKLALAQLAPTVLVSGQGPEPTLAALRAAGFSPVRHDAAGQVQVERTEKTRVAPAPTAGLREVLPPPPTPRETPAEVAARLRSGTPAPVSARLDPLVEEIAPFTGLNEAEVLWLADAIDRGGEVLIDYVNKDGNVSDRVIGEIQLSGRALYAWCHLRDDWRWFDLGGIMAVSPVS